MVKPVPEALTGWPIPSCDMTDDQHHHIQGRSELIWTFKFQISLLTSPGWQWFPTKIMRRIKEHHSKRARSPGQNQRNSYLWLKAKEQVQVLINKGDDLTFQFFWAHIEGSTFSLGSEKENKGTPHRTHHPKPFKPFGRIDTQKSKCLKCRQDGNMQKFLGVCGPRSVLAHYGHLLKDHVGKRLCKGSDRKRPLSCFQRKGLSNKVLLHPILVDFVPSLLLKDCIFDHSKAVKLNCNCGPGNGSFIFNQKLVGHLASYTWCRPTEEQSCKLFYMGHPARKCC